MDKHALIAHILAQAEEQLAALIVRQRDTAEGATHEESRSEHAKDTRATEQSYLARGLATRVEDLQRTVDALRHLDVRPFSEGDEIAVSAYVTILQENRSGESEPAEHWLVVPGAGGFELTDDAGNLVRTVTPVSPLGRALLGLSAGDEGQVRTPGGVRAFEVLDVC